MIQEDTDVGQSKMQRQLTNHNIPLQYSLQETLMKFRDPESLPVAQDPDSLADYRTERPLVENQLSQTPMVFGLMQSKEDNALPRDSVSERANPMQHNRNMVFENAPTYFTSSSSRMDARDVAAKAMRDQRRWDKHIQAQQDIRPYE